MLFSAKSPEFIGLTALRGGGGVVIPEIASGDWSIADNGDERAVVTITSPVEGILQYNTLPETSALAGIGWEDMTPGAVGVWRSQFRYPLGGATSNVRIRERRGALVGAMSAPKSVAVAQQGAPTLGATPATLALTVGVAMTPVSLTATGPAGLPIRLGATGLPLGLSVVGGQIVGTPLAAGSATITVVADNRVLSDADAWPPASGEDFHAEIGGTDADTIDVTIAAAQAPELLVGAPTSSGSTVGATVLSEGGGAYLLTAAGASNARVYWDLGGPLDTAKEYTLDIDLDLTLDDVVNGGDGSVYGCRILLAADVIGTSPFAIRSSGVHPSGPLTFSFFPVDPSANRRYLVLQFDDARSGDQMRVRSISLREKQAPVVTTPTQRGVTFNFAGNPTWGRYPNGDIWVVDSGSGVTVNSIDPPAALLSGRFSRKNTGGLLVNGAGQTGTTLAIRLASTTSTDRIPLGIDGALLQIGGVDYDVTGVTFGPGTFPKTATLTLDKPLASSPADGSIFDWFLSWGAGGAAWFHGAEKNPGRDDPTDTDGTPFDGRASGGNYLAYDDARNVDPGRTGAPLVLAAGDALAKAVSWIEAPTSRYLVDDYVILTVVGAAPAANALRPGPADPDRTHRWTTDDLNLSLFRSVTAPVSRRAMAQMSAGMTPAYPFTQMSGNDSENIRPMNTWGRIENAGGAYWSDGCSIRLAEAMLALHTDATPEQKRELAARLAQFGIDAYGRARAALAVAGTYNSPGMSINGAGHDVARLMPMFLTGLMLNDANILSAFAALGPSDSDRQQTFYVSQATVDRTRGFQGADRPAEPYVAQMIGTAEWAQFADAINISAGGINGGIAASNWSATYRGIARSALLTGALALRLIDGARESYGYGALFDYADRAFDIELPSGGIVDTLRGIPQFTRDMWATLRFDAGQGRPVVEGFDGSMWSVSPGGSGEVLVSVAGIPVGDGNPVTAIEYSLNGSTWSTLTATTGDYLLSGFRPAVAPVANALSAAEGAPRWLQYQTVGPLSQDWRTRPAVRGGAYTIAGLTPAAAVSVQLRPLKGASAGPASAVKATTAG